MFAPVGRFRRISAGNRGAWRSVPVTRQRATSVAPTRVVPRCDARSLPGPWRTTGRQQWLNPWPSTGRCRSRSFTSSFSPPPSRIARHRISCAGRSGAIGRELAIATSFQAEGMVLLDMAWRIDPGIRVITVDSGRLPPGDLRPDRSGARALPDSNRGLFARGGGAGTLRRRARPQSVLPQSGAARPLLRDPQGLAADPGADRVRRLGLRPAAGPSDDPTRHSRRRTRQGSRRHREAQSPGELERRVRSGTTCALTTCPTTRSTTGDSPASAARPAPAPPDPATIRAPAAGGGRPRRPRSAACTAD